MDWQEIADSLAESGNASFDNEDNDVTHTIFIGDGIIEWEISYPIADNIESLISELGVPSKYIDRIIHAYERGADIEITIRLEQPYDIFDKAVVRIQYQFEIIPTLTYLAEHLTESEINNFIKRVRKGKVLPPLSL